jgi:hypothetical protein
MFTPRENHETIGRRSQAIVRKFWRQLRELDNRARLLVLGILSIVFFAPPLLWWAFFERDAGGKFFGAANSSAFAVLSAAISFLGALLSTLVLIRLEGIRSTEQFLRSVAAMLDEAQSGNEFIFVAPTFNIQAIPNKALYRAYRRAFISAVKRGTKITLSYYQNDVCVDTFMAHNDNRNEKNTLLNTHAQCEFVKFHLAALDYPHQELHPKVDYFTLCFGFLQQLRAAGLTNECIYVKPTGNGVSADEHPVFVGNIDTGSYLFGDFVVNPGAPQEIRVDVIGDHAKAPNSISADTLAALIRRHEGTQPQPGRSCSCSALKPTAQCLRQTPA